MALCSGCNLSNNNSQPSAPSLAGRNWIYQDPHAIHQSVSCCLRVLISEATESRRTVAHRGAGFESHHRGRQVVG